MTSPTPEQMELEDLKKFTDSKDHEYNCAANSEGQLCCLEAGHVNYPKIAALVAAREQAAYKAGLEQNRPYYKRRMEIEQAARRDELEVPLDLHFNFVASRDYIDGFNAAVSQIEEYRKLRLATLTTTEDT